MPQMQLPMFPAGTVHLTPDLAAQCGAEEIVYYHGTLPVFRHRREDVQSFRLFTSQLYVQGHVQQSDLVRVFGVTAISVKRAVKLYREEGPGGFWRARATRGAAVLTTEVLAQVQAALDQGQELKDIVRAQGLKADTLRKAVRAGRLHRAKKKVPTQPVR